MLQKALDQDEYEHADVSQYTMDSAYSEVYEDENGPIGVLRCTKVLRMVCVWTCNEDKKRNALGTIEAVKNVVERAKANGFREIIFHTDSPTLAKFCQKLGFNESSGEYVLHV
jgi:hypothetical protein